MVGAQLNKLIMSLSISRKVKHLLYNDFETKYRLFTSNISATIDLQLSDKPSNTKSPEFEPFYLSQFDFIT